MERKISAEQLIKIVNDSALDPTIKEILIRDLTSEGATEFLVEQVLAYCDNAIEVLKEEIKKKENPA